MTIRWQGGVALTLVLLSLAAGCRQARAWKISGPPRDSRYLGVAILTSESASVKSDRVATRNGARVDFYLLNLTSDGWKATVSFPQVPAGTSICRANASSITDVELGAESDATAKCLLDREGVDQYCDSLTPPAAPNVPPASGAQAPAAPEGGKVEAGTRSVCEIEYTITFTGPNGKKVVDPRLEIER